MPIPIAIAMKPTDFRIGIDIEGETMSFGHERLDVYRIALEYVQFVWNICENLTGKHRHARDQLLRASQSIPLNGYKQI